MGKSRLIPTNAVTVPRLELIPATVSVRVGQMLYEELEVNPETITYHTDSTTVRYIGNEQKRFQIFVANRVQLIRDFTRPKQWRFVDTNSNPADDASRGLSAVGLLQQQRWLDKWPTVLVEIGNRMAAAALSSWASPVEPALSSEPFQTMNLRSKKVFLPVLW